MKAIILAAGMGTRLGKYTENLPKGMLNFLGKTLIERQIEIMRECGIDDIIIVTGYKSEKIQFPDVKYFHNEEFDSTNMVESLFKAEAELNGGILVAYSDIIYEKRVLDTVLKSQADVGVTVDKDYWQYWTNRLDEPEKDIESMVIDDEGKIVELGDTSCPLDRAKIRYVGLIKFSAAGIESLKEIYHQQKNLHYDENIPWMRSKCFKKAYMTCLLQALINAGSRVEPIYISRGWLEFDTVEDYERATSWNNDRKLDKFIKLDN